MDHKENFYDITNLVQQEFDRNLKLYGNKIQCGRGCSKCCSHIFQITLLDGWIITEHVKSLHENERQRLITKAKDYLDNLPLTKGEYRISGEGLPCPALGAEGECTLYEARPIICRRFGMPIYDYKKPDNVYACDLNFMDGEEINDPLLIPNQTEIGKKWDEVKKAFGEGATTIADAIVKAGND